MLHPVARLFLLSGLRDNVWLFAGFLALLFVLVLLRGGLFVNRIGNYRASRLTGRKQDGAGGLRQNQPRRPGERQEAGAVQVADAAAPNGTEDEPPAEDAPTGHV